MKNNAKILLILAACLAALGVILIGVSFILGATPMEAISYASFGPTSGVTVTEQTETVEVDPAVYAATEFRSLDIHWTSGSVTILLTDDDRIGLSETSDRPLTEDQKLYKTVRGNELVVQYRKEASIFGVTPSKDLTVHLPRTYAEQIQTISISVASADVYLSGISLNRLSFDSASGSLTAHDMTAEYLEANTASGDIDISGAVTELVCDTTSGSVTAHQTDPGCMAEVETSSGKITLSGAYAEVEADSTSGEISVASSSPLAELEAESTSGDVLLMLPPDAAFTLEFDTSSGDFSTELPLSRRGKSYLLNNGGPEFEISTTSGSLQILSYRES